MKYMIILQGNHTYFTQVEGNARSNVSPRLWNALLFKIINYIYICYFMFAKIHVCVSTIYRYELIDFKITLT